MSRKRNAPRRRYRHDTRQGLNADDNIDVVLHQYKTKWQKEQATYRRKIIREDYFGAPPILTQDLCLRSTYYGQRPSQQPEKSRTFLLRAESKEEQEQRHEHVIVGAVSIAVGPKQEPHEDFAVASMVVADLDTETILKEDTLKWVMDKPYIATYLAFREVEPLVELVHKVTSSLPKTQQPQVLFVCGTGILHPRYCGLASQLGVMLNMPTIGLTTTILRTNLLRHDDFWDWAQNQNPRQNNVFKLYEDEQSFNQNSRPIGYALRLRDRAKRFQGYLFVSTGHRISAMSALKITASFLKPRDKFPWPLQRAKKNAVRERQAIIEQDSVEDEIERFMQWKRARYQTFTRENESKAAEEAQPGAAESRPRKKKRNRKRYRKKNAEPAESAVGEFYPGERAKGEIVEGAMEGQIKGHADEEEVVWRARAYPKPAQTRGMDVM